MSRTEPIVRQYSEADREAIFSLLHEHMGFRELDISFWDWKFKKGTIAGLSLGFVIEMDNKVAGFCSFTQVRFVVGGNEMMGWESADCVVHKGFRRQGLFTELYSRVLDILDRQGSSFTYTFPSSMSYKIFKRLGYRYVCNVPYFVLVPDWKALMGRKLPRQVVNFMGIFYGDRCRKFMEIYRQNDFSITKIKQFRDGVDFSTGRGRLIHVKRDADYLNSRYCNHPWHEYDIFLAGKGGENLGFMILRGGNIVDIFSHSDEVFRALIGVAIEYFREKKILMAHLYLQCDDSKRRILKKAGFIRYNCRKRFFGLYPQQPMIVRANPMLDLGINLYVKDNWYFCMGDIALGL